MCASVCCGRDNRRLMPISLAIRQARQVSIAPVLIRPATDNTTLNPVDLHPLSKA